jgi:membrane fusion protein, multidrug efflux system
MTSITFEKFRRGFGHGIHRLGVSLSPCLPLSLSPCLLVLLLAGCGSPSAATNGAKPPPPEVTVSAAVTKEVTDYEDFPARVESVNSVDIKARVTGYLDKVNFTDGTDVKQGDVLFEVDPRPYEVELARTEGAIVQTQGRLKRLEADLQRGMTLVRVKSMSPEEYDKIAGDRTEAVGTLEVAKADRDKAKINLAWTKVKAPISGRISRRLIDPGNLVKADETVLTSIVDMDHMYAYFDVDERTTLKFQKLVRDGKIQWSMATGLPVMLGLVDEEGYPRTGTINFADNRLDADSGTWRLRAVFDNADHALSPGMYVRMRLPIGKPYQTVLVAEQALGTDQGQKFVYVVDDSNMVSSRRVKIGRIHQGLRAISEGLAEGEKVIVSGLQRARQGIEVQPALAANNEQKSEIRNPKSETNSKSENNPKSQ